VIDLKEAILQTCFERFDGQFAAGDRANNRVNLDRLAKNEELKNYCIKQLGSLAIAYQAEFVTAVPDGANWIARNVSERFGLPLVELFKYPDTGQIDFRTKEDEEITHDLACGALFEDVARTFHSLQKVLALDPLDEKVIVIGSIFDRGNPATRNSLQVPHIPLVREYIPPLLPKNSDYWKYADGKS